MSSVGSLDREGICETERDPVLARTTSVEIC